MSIDPGLLEILVCPQCRAGLFLDTDRSELVCNGCMLAYPIRRGIPVMLVEEARQLSEGQ